MASKPLIVATLVGASVGVPYFTSQIQQAQKPNATAVGVAAKPIAGTPAAPVQMVSSSGAPVYTSGSKRLDGVQFTSFTQVLRFDVKKEWVYQNWSRKTSAPTDVGLLSVRVPLVMSGNMSALAGALTYFFNDQGQVEHISFRGSTGDATQLVQWLRQYYQFQQVQSPTGAQVYQVQSGEGVQSELQIQPESLMNSNAPQQNIAVQLEFARPGSPRLLPPRAPALQIPTGAAPMAEATPAAAAEPASEGMTAAVKSAASGYWDQIHYATPEEQTPALLRRWPN